MRSPVVKRSIVIAGHKTSVSLEDAFWQGLKQIAAGRSLTLSDLVASIDHDRHQGNLSSAIRLFVLDHYRSRSDNVAGGSYPAEGKIEKENPRGGGASHAASSALRRPE